MTSESVISSVTHIQSLGPAAFESGRAISYKYTTIIPKRLLPPPTLTIYIQDL